MGKCRAGMAASSRPTLLRGRAARREVPFLAGGLDRIRPYTHVHCPFLDSTGCKALWANQGNFPYQQRLLLHGIDSVQSFTQRS
jgi:hypothetical protein